MTPDEEAIVRVNHARHLMAHGVAPCDAVCIANGMTHGNEIGGTCICGDSRAPGYAFVVMLLGSLCWCVARYLKRRRR